MSQLKLEILLDMANKVSAPLKAMQTDTKNYSDALSKVREELKNLEKQEGALNRYKDMQRASRAKMTEIRDEVAKIKTLSVEQEKLGQTIERFKNTLKEEVAEQTRSKAVYQEKRQEIVSLEKAYRQGLIVHDKYKIREKELRLEVQEAKQAQIEQNKAVKEAKAALAPLTQEMKKIESEMDKSKKATAAMGEEFRRQRDRVNVFRKELNDSGISTSKLIDEDKKLKAAIAQSRAEVEKKTAALERHQLSLKTTAEREEKFRNILAMRDRLQSSGMQNIAAGVAVLYPAKKMISAFADAEDAAVELKTTMMNSLGQVAPEFEKVNQLAIQLGNKLPGTTADFQNMMTTLQQNGVRSQDILAGVGKATAYLAVALKMPTSEAAQFAARMATATGVANTEMLQFMDTIAKTRNLGVQVEEMKFAFSRSGGKLKELGIQGLEASQKMGVFYAMMIKTGLSGETVGTGFAAMLSSVQDYTYGLTKGGRAAKAALDAKGIKLDLLDGSGKLKDVRGMIAEFEKLKSLDAQTKATVLNSLIGKGQDAQMLATLIEGGTAAYDEMNKKMQDQADLNAKVETQLNTLKNLWDAASGTAVNALAAIGESISPDIKNLTEILGKAAEKVSAFAKEHPQLTRVMTLSVLSLGALSLGVGMAQLAFGRALGAFVSVGKALAWLGKGKDGVSGLTKIKNAMTSFAQATKNGGSKVIAAYKKISPMITASAQKMGRALSVLKTHTLSLFKGMGQGLIGVAKNLGKGLAGVVRGMGQAFVGIYQAYKPIFSKLGQIMGSAMMKAARSVWMLTRALLTNPIVLLITGIALAAYLIYKHWDKIYPFIKGLWERVSNYLSGLADRFVSIGSDIISGLWNGLKSRWNSVSSWLSEKIASLPEGVRKLLGIQSPSRVFMAIGGHTMDGLHIGLEQRFGRVREFMARATQSLIPSIHRPAFAEIGVGHGAQPSIRRSDFAPVRQTSARDYHFEHSGDIVIQTVSGDPHEIRRIVRAEMEQVYREFDRRMRSSMVDRD